MPSFSFRNQKPATALPREAAELQQAPPQQAPSPFLNSILSSRSTQQSVPTSRKSARSVMGPATAQTQLAPAPQTPTSALANLQLEPPGPDHSAEEAELAHLQTEQQSRDAAMERLREQLEEKKEQLAAMKELYAKMAEFEGSYAEDHAPKGKAAKMTIEQYAQYGGVDYVPTSILNNIIMQLQSEIAQIEAMLARLDDEREDDEEQMRLLMALLGIDEP